MPIAIRYLAVVIVGYIGIYLCRKNLGVAVPLIQEDLGVDKQAIGVVASISTIAYAVGKVFWGPLVDRIGGRIGFLTSMTLVALFCGLGGFAPSLGALIWIYSLNRFAGSGGWSGMIKQMPDWFPLNTMGKAMAVLSLSFVVGGICAAFLAGQIAVWSDGDWRWVMGGPAIALALIIGVAAALLPRTSTTTPQLESQGPDEKEKPKDSISLASLFTNRAFYVVCGLSFTLTLMRETFSTWSVDFLETLRTGDVTPESVNQSARLSALFDAWGFVGILLMGLVYDFLGLKAKRLTLAGLLGALAFTLLSLDSIGRNMGVVTAAWVIGGVGFLSRNRLSVAITVGITPSRYSTGW